MADLSSVESNIDKGEDLPEILPDIINHFDEAVLDLEKEQPENNYEEINITRKVIRSKINVITEKSRLKRPVPVHYMPISSVARDLEKLDVNLGSGAFGSVELMRYKKLDLKLVFAVKKVNIKEAISFGMTKTKIRMEGEILDKLKHVNILQLYQHLQSEDLKDYYFITEYVDGCKLTTFIGMETKSHSLDVIWKFCKQIVSGLVYIHGERVLHRDLKPDNILISTSNVVKIIDFGLSKELADSLQAATSRVGSMTYSSEEKFREESYDGRDDVWALGCILCELMMNKSINSIFPGVRLSDPTRKYALDNILDKCLQQGRNHKLLSVIQRCLDVNYESRSTAAHLFAHMEWADLQGIYAYNNRPTDKLTVNASVSIVLLI
jgi:serine/threonine protein kinase